MNAWPWHPPQSGERARGGRGHNPHRWVRTSGDDRWRCAGCPAFAFRLHDEFGREHPGPLPEVELDR